MNGMSNGSLLLEEKGLNAVKRMRCSRRSGVIFLAMITAIAWPTPHHRLRRSLSSRRSLLVSASANYRHPPCLIITPNHRPRGSGQRSWTQGWRSQTEGEKQEANGGKLAFIRAVQAFTCHGAQNVSAAFQFYSTDFHVTTQPSLILSLYAPRYCLTASAGFGGNLQNCAPSAACGGAMAPRKNRFLVPLVTPSRTARPRTCRACAPWSGRSARPKRPRWSAHSGWDQNPSPWP